MRYDSTRCGYHAAMTLLLLAMLAADPVDLFPESMRPDGETVRIGFGDGDGVFNATDEGFDIKSVDASQNAWLNQAILRTTGPIAKGDVLLLEIPVTLVDSPDGSARIKISLTHEPVDNVDPDGLKYDEIMMPGGAGASQTFYSSLTADRDVPAGEGRLALHFSAQPQTLEIGRVRLRNYGPEFPLTELPKNDVGYQGREPGAAWRDEAAARIREHRMGPIAVEVVDEAGEPVAGAKVHAKLVRHAFGFGSAIRYPLIGAEESEFPLSLWTDDEWSWEDAERYREIVAEQFSRVTFEAACRPQVWPAMHNPAIKDWPIKARAEQLQLMKAFAFLDDNKIELRGHYLSWGAIDHGEQVGYVGRPDEHWAYQTRIAREHPIQLATRVAEWDVLNHPCGWGVTMESLHGGLGLHAETMRIARESAPKGTKLYVNEGHVLHERSQIPNYERIIRHLIDEGHGPDGIGFMGHFNDKSLTGMDDAWAVFERFGKLADHLQITELDISSPSDEQLQADYLRDIVTLAFSHPKMDGVVQWGFWEGAHWKPETALYRRDWSPKPAGLVWKELLTDTWHTFEQGTTDADGRFAVDAAFHGDYEIYGTREGDDGPEMTWQIVDDATDRDMIRVVMKPRKSGE